MVLPFNKMFKSLPARLIKHRSLKNVCVCGETCCHLQNERRKNASIILKWWWLNLKFHIPQTLSLYAVWGSIYDIKFSIFFRPEYQLAAMYPRVDSAPNTNEYQWYLLRVKAIVWKFWETQTLGALGPVQACIPLPLPEYEQEQGGVIILPRM